MSWYQRVGMRVNQTHSLDWFLGFVLFVWRHRSCNDILSLICSHNLLPQILLIGYVIMNYHISWSTCQGRQSLSNGPTFNPLIASIDLCPSFLKYEHPNLLVFWTSAECPVVFVVTPWEVVINNYNLWLSIDIELHCIAASIIDFIRNEDVFHSIWELSKRWDRWEEVTVTTISLLDVFGRYLIVKLEVSNSKGLNRTFPCVSLPTFESLWPHNGRIKYRVNVWFEVWISPRFLSIDNRFVINLL